MFLGGSIMVHYCIARVTLLRDDGPEAGMHYFLLVIHIGGGGVALMVGAAALALPKGERLHRRCGTLFFAAMAVMTATGSLLAILRPERITAVIGLLTLYLVTTSWMAAKRREGTAGTFERAGFAVAAAFAATFMAMGLVAAASPTGRLDSLPAAVPFVFGTLAALAAALDLNFILRRRLSGRQRIARHLWRMCAALLIATSSFFLGQQDEFPQAVQGSPIFYLPSLATLAAMIFWIFRVRFGQGWNRGMPSRPAPIAPPSPGIKAPA